VAINHSKQQNLQPAAASSSPPSFETVEPELTDTPPQPLNSWDDFNMKGTLAGDYDPFSQVRHLVDDVFRQHEERVKQGQPLPPSSFLEVTSYRRPSSSSSSSTDKPVQQQGSHRTPASASSSSSSSSDSSSVSSLPVKYRSPTALSAPLTAPNGFVPAHLQDDESMPAVLLELGSKVQKVQSFCEICILIMQMKERGEPHLCAGLNSNYYITCVENLESLLRADKALVYWLKEGCMHLDSEGPEIVRPCPAINICSWVPNLFTPPPTIVRDEVESLCPKDLRFLPTIPEEYRAILGSRRLF